MSVFVHVSNVIYVYVVYNIHMYTSLIISSSSHTQTTTHRLQYPVQNHMYIFSFITNQQYLFKTILKQNVGINIIIVMDCFISVSHLTKKFLYKHIRHNDLTKENFTRHSKTLTQV